MEYILDTNLYISFFTNRDVNQYQTAFEHIERAKKDEIEICLPDLISAEIVYVLSTIYEFSREQISTCLMSLISLDNIQAQNKDVTLTALSYFEVTNLDFADCYLLALKEINNCKIITFDQKLKNINI